MQKQRDIYLDQYDKLPEHPKKQKDFNEKRELKKLIDDLNMNINEYKRQERNIKKNYFEYIWLKIIFLIFKFLLFYN